MASLFASISTFFASKASGTHHPAPSPTSGDQNIGQEITVKSSEKEFDPSDPDFMLFSLMLERYPVTKDKILPATIAIQKAFPVLPLIQIVYPGGPWNRDKAYFIHFSHLNPSFARAVENINSAGRTLDKEEELYLRFVLSHPTGWSATPKDHHEDAWVQYITHKYGHIQGLRPILDDMTWPEEAKLFPASLVPGYPELFLFANETAYYIFYLENDELYRAGSSLKEVYEGMLARKYFRMEPGGWEAEPDNGEDYGEVFPFYRWRGDEVEGQWVLSYKLEEYKPIFMGTSQWRPAEEDPIDPGTLSHEE